MLIREKRGQGLSTNAIVLIVLAVVVLVILIAGFTVGWSKILPFLSTNNVDAVVTGCSSACATESVYNFCTFERTLKAEGLSDEASRGTCYKFSTNQSYASYGIAGCPALAQECASLLSEEE